MIRRDDDRHIRGPEHLEEALKLLNLFRIAAARETISRPALAAVGGAPPD
ncbi:MAG: hypothetical protein O2960_27120 [Verrucomicrobia bacterium]|nr:hypothetical protein [Verrucomicrobiota bacterium]